MALETKVLAVAVVVAGGIVVAVPPAPVALETKVLLLLVAGGIVAAKPPAPKTPETIVVQRLPAGTPGADGAPGMIVGVFLPVPTGAVTPGADGATATIVGVVLPLPAETPAADGASCSPSSCRGIFIIQMPKCLFWLQVKVKM